MAGISIFYIILGKFRPKKMPCPIILFEIAKNLKIRLDHSVISLILAVYLWVESVGKFLLNGQEIV